MELDCIQELLNQKPHFMDVWQFFVHRWVKKYVLKSAIYSYLD